MTLLVRHVFQGVFLCTAFLIHFPTQAHLIEAQRGSLNLRDRAAYLVLSIPVSALSGVDDDGDAALSQTELRRHADIISVQIKAGVQLLDAKNILPLKLVMLEVSPPHSSPDNLARHLVVMGWFDLGGLLSARNTSNAEIDKRLRLRFRLFGNNPGERQQDIVISRRNEKKWLRFTPERIEYRMFY
jgi:hypothetical protein